MVLKSQNILAPESWVRNIPLNPPIIWGIECTR